MPVRIDLKNTAVTAAAVDCRAIEISIGCQTQWGTRRRTIQATERKQGGEDAVGRDLEDSAVIIRATGGGGAVKLAIGAEGQAGPGCSPVKGSAIGAIDGAK